MQTFISTVEDLTVEQVEGLFQYWGKPSSSEAILRIFHGSDHVVLAIDDATGKVIGYITALSDGVSCAYIPHLEVRQEFQGQGIGSALVQRMRERLNHLYMIDLICDNDLIPFYEKHGFRSWTGMIARNYDRQQCDP